VGATVDLFPGSQLFRRAKSSSPKTSRSFSRAWRRRPDSYQPFDALPVASEAARV